MVNRTSAAIVGAAVGLAAGLALRYLAPAAEDATSSSAAVRPSHAPVAQATGSDAIGPGVAADGFAHIDTVVTALALPDSFRRTQALYAMAARGDAATLKRLIDEAQQLPLEAERFAASRVLFQRLAQIDGNDALTHMRSLSLIREARMARVIFTAWAEVDLDEALEAVRALDNERSVQVAGEAVLAAFPHASMETVDGIVARLPAGFDASGAQLERLANDPEASPEEALEAALRIADAATRGTAARGIAERWASADPAAALAFGQQIGHVDVRRAFLQGVFGRWARNDADAALTAIVEMPPGPMRHPLRLTALKQLTAVDPGRALDWARRLEKGRNYGGYSTAVVKQWAARDPVAASRRLAELPPDARNETMSTLAGHYANADPAGALDWATHLVAGNERVGALAAVAGVVARSDPDMAVAYLRALPDERERAAGLSAVVNQLASQGDAVLAATLLDDIPRHQQRRGAVFAVARSWALSDVSTALTFAESRVGPERAIAIDSIIGIWAELDLPAAAAYVRNRAAQLPSGAVVQVATRMAASDPAGALDWLQTTGRSPDRGSATMSVYSTWAGRDPAAAMAHAVRLDDDEARARAVTMVASDWARVDARAAAQAVGDLPEDILRTFGVGQVMSSLMHDDPVYARRWAEGLPNGDSRDEALSHVVMNDTLDAADVVRVVNAIQSDSRRFEAMSGAVYGLARRDPDAATRLLGQVELTADQRRQLEEFIAQLEAR